mmetsp:Transcript_1460/g.2008  ORF Transcript_1460/g.2008 Transcript_1460/m.2008 type:complete len:109 (-) Transcript_1460:89-415(-)
MRQRTRQVTCFFTLNITTTPLTQETKCSQTRVDDELSLFCRAFSCTCNSSQAQRNGASCKQGTKSEWVLDYDGRLVYYIPPVSVNRCDDSPKQRGDDNLQNRGDFIYL